MKKYSDLNLTEATRSINALQTAFKRANIRVLDPQILRLAQLDFTPESNEIQMILSRSTTIGELFETIDLLPEVPANHFDTYQPYHQQKT